MKPKTITGHGVPKQPPGRGPNGRRFCRWCHQEVPRRRQSYCNDECWQYADFNYSKRVAMGRDKYRCVQCQSNVQCEVDHIVAVKDGGNHHPDNLRTLCRKCHKARTAQQAAERAAKRRDAKATLYSQEAKP